MSRASKTDRWKNQCRRKETEREREEEEEGEEARGKGCRRPYTLHQSSLLARRANDVASLRRDKRTSWPGNLGIAVGTVDCWRSRRKESHLLRHG